VERVLEILEDEIATAVRLLGVNSVHEIGRQHVNIAALMGLVYTDLREELGTHMKAKL
jgi:isopentenyl diphosphate isomerase/L-lactate dehydrogenase-like FMN-dependent dehydrogenase